MLARTRLALVGAAAASLALLASGCRDFAEHRAALADLHARGQYDLAARVLDASRKDYGRKNEVLWKLDRGATALALSDDTTAISLLNEAEDAIDLKRDKSAKESVGQWVFNDTAAPYVAEPYEDLYLNVIKMAAQLQAGRIEGGATVEARRMAGKADRLRDLYLKYRDQATERGVRLSEVNDEGRFIESTLGTFLSAVAFMKAGEPEMQRVAGKRLVSSIELQRALIGPVEASDFAGMDELDPREVNVLVVAFSGRGPTKYAARIGPFPAGTVPIYLEIPKLRAISSHVARARVEVADSPDSAGGGEGGGGAGQPLMDLKMIEDLASVAEENHRRMLPLIEARTWIRYAVKAGISVTATELARRRANDDDQRAVQVAGVLLGLALLAATEEADLRCWTMLPGQARVGLTRLPPGEHRVRVVYERADGSVAYASDWRTIRVEPRGLATVITHYWN